MGTLKWLLLVCVIPCSLVGAKANESELGFGVEVPRESRAQVLGMLSSRSRENYEKMRSWRGNYRFVDGRYESGPNPSLHPDNGHTVVWSAVEFPQQLLELLRREGDSRDGYWSITRGNAEFLIDSIEDKYLVHIENDNSLGFVDIMSGLQMEVARRRNGLYYIFSPESAIEFDEGMRQDTIEGFKMPASMPPTRIVNILPLEEGKRAIEAIDVRDCFGEGSVLLSGRGTWYWATPARYAEVLETMKPELVYKNIDKSLRIFVTSDVNPTYTVLFGFKDRTHTITRFDSGSNFNVTSHIVNKGSTELTSRKMSYRNEGGVFIPELFTSRIADPVQEGARARFVRLLKLESSEVNGVVSATEFTIDKLNLQYADGVVNRITGELSFFDDKRSGLVPAEEFQYETEKPLDTQNMTQPMDKTKVGNTGSRLLLYGNLTIAVAFGVFVLLRRCLRSTS